MNTDRNSNTANGADKGSKVDKITNYNNINNANNKEILLSDRMLSVANMVTKGNVVCDVGCDHGFVSIYLVKKAISPRAIAMDVRQGPLDAAREHVKAYALTDYIETRLSDGVSAVAAGEADSLICAGMGGRLVKRILEEGKDKVRLMKELILQPQSEIRGVREYLRRQGYMIAAENMVLEDDKYYPVIKAVFTGETSLPENGDGTEDLEDIKRVEDKYGPLLLKSRNPVLKGFLIKERMLCETILNGLKKPACPDNIHTDRQGIRQGEIMSRIEDIDTALSYYQL